MALACAAKIGVFVGRWAIEMNVQEKRNIGIPKRRSLDRVRDDIKETVGGPGEVGPTRPCHMEA